MAVRKRAGHNVRPGCHEQAAPGPMRDVGRRASPPACCVAREATVPEFAMWSASRCRFPFNLSISQCICDAWRSDLVKTSDIWINISIAWLEKLDSLWPLEIMVQSSTR